MRTYPLKVGSLQYPRIFDGGRLCAVPRLKLADPIFHAIFGQTKPIIISYNLQLYTYGIGNRSEMDISNITTLQPVESSTRAQKDPNLGIIPPVLWSWDLDFV